LVKNSGTVGFSFVVSLISDDALHAASCDRVGPAGRSMTSCFRILRVVRRLECEASWPIAEYQDDEEHDRLI